MAINYPRKRRIRVEVTCFRTVLWPVLARGRPCPARFVRLSRELTVQWWHICPGVIYQGSDGHDVTRLRPTAPGTWHLRACL
jgi:hypothetical protein